MVGIAPGAGGVGLTLACKLFSSEFNASPDPGAAGCVGIAGGVIGCTGMTGVCGIGLGCIAGTGFIGMVGGLIGIAGAFITGVGMTGVG